MKTIALSLALLGGFAAPVLACPGMDHHEETPRTVEKDKAPAKKDAPPAKTADKAAPAKDAKDAKAPAPAKTPEKKPEKVSSR